MTSRWSGICATGWQSCKPGKLLSRGRWIRSLASPKMPIPNNSWLRPNWLGTRWIAESLIETRHQGKNQRVGGQNEAPGRMWPFYWGLLRVYHFFLGAIWIASSARPRMDSYTASDKVGWAWMTEAMSWTVMPLEMARAGSWIRSEAWGPMI